MGNNQSVPTCIDIQQCTKQSAKAVWKRALPDSGLFSSLAVRERQAIRARDVFELLRNEIIGGDLSFKGPFGVRKVIYCDFTASGRPLRFVEEFIQNNVLPHYANVHSMMGLLAAQTSHYRQEARNFIKKSVKATDDDAVIFTGAGSTAAVHKFVHVIGLTDPEKVSECVVLVGPYEHHSNILPWRETGVTLERIKMTETGLVDSDHLRKLLEKWSSKEKRIIVALSAASNVTGILVDTDSLTSLIHEYGAVACWDYATSAPYVTIDMNPGGTRDKDAIFISCHKFLGGPQSPGVLIAKKSIFTNSVPHQCGGGTVLYVTRKSRYYCEDIEEREEGGTPAIIESIRAGLVFCIKDEIGSELLERREISLAYYGFIRWSAYPNLVILGNRDHRRLPIFSFLIRHPETGRFLHHNFVAALLNDLFGIQSRPGCACAGPYAQDLLEIEEPLADKYTWFLAECRRCDTLDSRIEIMKPGFCRLNLPFFYDSKTVDFIIDAVGFVSNDGWKLLPLYQYDALTGKWRHRQFQYSQSSISGVSLRGEGKVNVSRSDDLNVQLTRDIRTFLEDAETLVSSLKAEEWKCEADPEIPYLDKERAGLRWFLLPIEAKQLLLGKRLPHHPAPFQPDY